MEEALIQWQEQELTQTGHYYKHICWMAVPLLWMSCYFYGPRPLLLCGVALLVGNLCDRLISLLRRRVYQPKDYSNESFALIIALLMPATVDWYVLVAAVLAGVLIGKEVFGGYGSYPFHPAAVGYVVAAVSWPEQVVRFPQPGTWLPLTGVGSAGLVQSASYTLKNGGTPRIDTLNLMLGNYAGPMGATAVVILVACALLLAVRRRIQWDAALPFLAACFAIAWLFPRMGRVGQALPWVEAPVRLASVGYELCSGTILYTSIFMLSDPVILPRHRAARVAFGLTLGVASMLYRYYGSYETGVCFAMILVGSFASGFDRLHLRWLDRKEALNQ